ncbi:peptide/nickel transport system substrate-binding protein [Salinihabitans flavidus]|uniref:Peptide/nickel transport system substrate-binding protein n=1 Tax=Salinihabitans flavidus TaxID=569882 RepID=A0A1H8MJ62_9RHOB|nr:ABC transporter substrate-binding protein [Salinihabitans flavidus]SEO17445.1 peptide/nickel transport system substrate-binding protein [Salinihabitans flavidus]
MKHSGTTRRGFLASTAAIGAMGLMPALPTAGFAQAGSVLRLRLDGDNDILDPGYMSGGTEIEAQKQCLPFLAQYDRTEEGFDWAPTYFVTKLEQRDPTHIDFELAEGLVWSNGYGPVRASDVKFSYERMKGTDWSGYFDAMDHVEVTGERSGTIVLSEPFAPFIMITLCHGPGAVLCEQAVKDAGGEFTNEFPAVCGPYTYEAIPGQRVIFHANPDWAGPKPAFERIEANVISEVKAAELAFEAGELDCTEVGADTLARYTKNMPDNTEITVAGELQYMWMGMNTDHPKLQDIRVRKAIQRAVDVDSILQGAYSGTTSKSHGIICPGLIGNRDQSGYSYDPAEARALLEEAGVSGLELTLRTLNNQERMLAAQIIQANLGAIGITVKVLPVESGPYWEMGQESKGDTWKDLELWIMRFGTTPDPYEAAQWFVSDQVGKWNWERWTDPEFDRLYQEGIVETDPEKREAIYVRMQEIMEDTGAYLWINHEPEAFVHTTDIDVNAAPSGELNYRLFDKA